MRTTAEAPVRAGAPRPRTLGELYWAFTLLALQGFGGVLAVVQRELVEKKRWLTPQEFVEDWAVAQIMPGPNVVNLAVTLGDRYFGWRGALTALAGMLSMPLVVVIGLAVSLEHVADTAQGQGALRGLGAVAAGLIAATGLKLMPTLRGSPAGHRQALGIVLVTFVLIGLVRLPLVWVLLVVGAPACLWTWVSLRRLDAGPDTSRRPTEPAP
jgi:chromate transporter